MCFIDAGLDLDNKGTDAKGWAEPFQSARGTGYPPSLRSLSQAFALWIGRIILPKLSAEPVTGIDDLREMRTMLADRIQEWGEEFKREGMQQGLQAGEAQLLLRLLRRRFGELPGWVQPHLQQAPSEQLERWGERLLEVDTLDALFEGK